MEFINIPNLHQNASRIALGTWAIGGSFWGGTDDNAAIKTIHTALDKGINIIDTAPAYGFGKSEEIVGKAIKDYGKRDQIIIATKVGLGWDNQQLYRDSSRKRILKEVEDSLKRLQVDYIDLYQVHWPDLDTPFSETATAIKELLEDGKIRAVGVSNFSVEQMVEFSKITPIHSNQIPFNLLEREYEEEFLPYCLKKQIATLGYGAICRGLLSGKMQKERRFQGDDIRKVDPKFQEPRYAEYLHCVERLQLWAKQKHNRSILALAVRWVLDKGISIALWGARTPEQLKDLNTIWGWKLTADDFREIDKIINETVKHPVGPEFMAPPERSTAGIRH